MKITVTGASGHVGPNLCKALLARGYKVKAIYLDKGNSLDHIKVKKSKGDILDFKYVKEALKGSDAIFHLACFISIKENNRGYIHRVNVEGTRNVVMAALEHGVKRLVHFSSIHSFNEEPSFEELNETRQKTKPSSHPYDYSKKLSEDEIMKGVEKGLDAVIVCPTSIMGPEDHEPSLLGQAMIKLYNGEIPSLIPGGYDWVDVRDVVEGAIAALERGRSGETYLLSGKFHTMKEVADLMEKFTGKKAPAFMTPFWLAKLSLPFVQIQSRFTGKEPPYNSEILKILQKANRCVSSAKAKRQLGYKHRSLEETIRDLFLWFREHDYIT